MIISTTAEQHGRGTDRYKDVVHLTPEERAAARAGETVMFRSEYRAGGKHGTTWRRVHTYRSYDRTRYVPRVPTPEQITQAEAAT